jgi:hypothetical protein
MSRPDFVCPTEAFSSLHSSPPTLPPRLLLHLSGGGSQHPGRLFYLASETPRHRFAMLITTALKPRRFSQVHRQIEVGPLTARRRERHLTTDPTGRPPGYFSFLALPILLALTRPRRLQPACEGDGIVVLACRAQRAAIVVL